MIALPNAKRLLGDNKFITGLPVNIYKSWRFKMIVFLIIAAAFVVGMLMPEPKEQAPVKEDYNFKIRFPKPEVAAEEDCEEELDPCCKTAA
jgi:hypothetical protein